MTKRKTQPFSGAWLDGRIPQECVRKILDGHVPSASIGPIIDVVSDQVALWRFHWEWVSVEPEPAQWASILRAITVPALPTPVESLRVQVALSKLPAQVRGVLAAEIFQRSDSGLEQIVASMIHGDPLAAEVLRNVLGDMIAGLANVKARRGPRMSKAPPFRAVHAALMNAGVPDSKARELASALLCKCGVSTPKSRSAIAELMQPTP